MTISPDFKIKWCAALRSGKYKQGIIQLRLGDAFCCMGVALDVHDPSKWSEGKIYQDSEDNFGYKTLRSELGFSTYDIDYFITLNDCQKLSFPKIADLIEAML